MASDGGVSCIRRPEMMNVGIGGMESPPLDVDEVHVLAVDDSLVDRIVIERLLRITSCKVTAVDSGWRALEFLGIDKEKASAELDKLKVDLIITDYCMPGMTGYELLKRIKESSSFRQVPVVIMSSENVITRIDRCLEEGAEDFLLKPVKLADVKRLRNYLTRDVKLSNGNKRKLPEDSIPVNISPPLHVSADLSDSSPPPLTHSPDSSDSSPPSLTLSSDSSDSSPPLSPVEIFSSPLSSPIDDEDDDVLTSSPESSLTPEESPVRRQKMRSPGLD